MKLTLLVIFISATLVYNCTIDKQSLSKTIHETMNRDHLQRISFGIEMLQKINGKWEFVFQHNHRKMMVPASNNKLITTAAAFLEFGKDYTLETSVFDNGDGDLCILGSGDAAFGFEAMKNLSKLVGKKVTHVNELYYDDVFPVFPDEWEWSYLVFDYGAQPTSFSLEGNTVALSVVSKTVDGKENVVIEFENKYDDGCIPVTNLVTASDSTSIDAFFELANPNLILSGTLKSGDQRKYNLAVNNPVNRYICVLKKMLQEENVDVVSFSPGKCDRNSFPSILATVHSPPFSTTMNHTLQVSDNLFAENYLRILGVNSKDYSGNAQSTGIKEVRKILTEHNVDPTSYQQHDGSGLSRHNIVSNEALSQLLVAMEKEKDFKVYKSFLPVAGQSGTLKNRFVGTIGEGIVHAKTGSVENVNSLGGYIDYGNGFIFSILTNGATIAASEMRKVIDEIVLSLIHHCN